MDEETRRIHRLLSGGKLSGPEADEIIERALDQLALEKRAKVRPIRYWAGGLLAAAAAVTLAVVLPRTPGGEVHDPEEGDFPPAKLGVTCSPGTLTACPISSSLVFSLSGQRASGFLSAYAEPIGHDAERIFYFSEEDGSVELASPTDAARRAQHSVRLSAAHRPGRYRIHAVLADQPEPRAALVGGGAIQAGSGKPSAKAQVEIVVVE